MSEIEEARLPVRPRPLPAPGTVACWLMDVAGLALADRSAATGRRARLQALRLRRQFLLRLILGAYLGRPGKEIALVREPSGKPALTAPASGGLSFSVSHSGSWLAIAVASRLPVGVDIETDRRLDRALALSRRYFSEPEAEHLAGLGEPERSQRFRVLWTAREACIKAMGGSLAASLASMAFDPASGKVLTLPKDWPAPTQWSVLGSDLPVPLTLRVAAPCPGLRLETIRLACAPG